MFSNTTHPSSYSYLTESYSLNIPEIIHSPETESEEDMWYPDMEELTDHSMDPSYENNANKDEVKESVSAYDFAVLSDEESEEAFREMEGYVNYNDDSDYLNTGTTTSHAPSSSRNPSASAGSIATSSIPQHVSSSGYAVRDFLSLKLLDIEFSAMKNIHHVPSSRSYPEFCVMPPWSLPAASPATANVHFFSYTSHALTTSSPTSSSSSMSDPYLLKGKASSSKAPARKRGTSAHPRKAPKSRLTRSRVGETPAQKSARRKRTSGVLTPYEVDALPSAEYTDREVRSILKIPYNIPLEDAWPWGPDPWMIYKPAQVLMLAICCRNHKATFHEIEMYIMGKYPLLETTEYGTEWRSTLRNYLSAYPQFRRLRREKGCSGGPWTLDATMIQ
ncbi:hypothetical protein JR316_0007567 [Psilocybe cubensis]|uniref:Fork-head domain-containing protein n=2 Tax=Psilocybe cubensis TaxID=181762 RepID=A0A8H7XNN4_PSICU|nr:hypothetical protein JR316_0007567 [Psilocybe cubensis]KAH9480960.1 hypothetical protein JR316_0007567 [Psilocybe cubensis]